jgi:hypothetical protein
MKKRFWYNLILVMKVKIQFFQVKQSISIITKKFDTYETIIQIEIL